jgi:hypothetical protein
MAGNHNSGCRPKLTRAQLEYARRADRILRRTVRKLSRKVVAHRLGLTARHLGVLLRSPDPATAEDWDAKHDA